MNLAITPNKTTNNLALDLEYAAAALGLPVPDTAKPRKPRPERLTGLRIKLSVRKRDSSGAPYGNPLVFEYQSQSPFRTTALLDAERAAREAGFEPWLILDDGSGDWP